MTRFTERQVDSIGVVDEQPQHVATRLLDGNEVDIRVKLGKLASGVGLQVTHKGRLSLRGARFGP